MPYSKFTLSRAVADFNLTVQEGPDIFQGIPAIAPSPFLQELLVDTVPWAVAVGSEKARSEGIINPVLLEVRRQLKGQVGVFSGEEFNVDAEADLQGYCDFLVSRSPEQLYITAPVVMLVEAKKEDLKPALGQPATQGSEETSEQSVAVCLAEMVAAQRFNISQKQDVGTIYGVVTSGTAWRFLKLEERVVSIDLSDYALSPVDRILGVLIWMLRVE
jgi:hypothetical protein